VTETIVAEFKDLFAGNQAAYGSWAGGCVKESPTITHFEQHLTYGPFIGTYPAWGERCAWGCIDIDGTKGNPDWDALWPIATRLVAALRYKGATPWIERTANGLHVWVFPALDVPAATMRRALLAACAAIDYRPKEVNPKQESVPPGTYGNYVRLPYYGYLVDGMPEDRVIVYEDDDLDLEEFLPLAREQPTSVSSLQQMARLWTPPETADTLELDASQSHVNLVPLLPNLAYTVWTEGPLDGDRSAALVKLVVLLRDDGWTPQATFTMLLAFDMKLGKFTGRDDRMEQLHRIMGMVYG